MSAYSEQDFLADKYTTYRPKYPASFFQKLISYHNGDKKLAVDVGCGPGEATFPLSKYFDHVIGIDRSNVMVKQANQIKDLNGHKNVEFRTGNGEVLQLNTNSVDLVAAAESLHWFDQSKFVQESYRLLRLGGTLAYWGYTDPVFVDYPDASFIYNNYVYLEPEYLGPYWETPGIDLLKAGYNHVELPPDLFGEVKRVDYEAGTRNREALVMKKQYYGTSQLKNFMKTWSAYHIWCKVHPDSPDVIDLLFDDLKKNLHWTEETVLNVEWNTFYVFATRM
ncbi:Ubiquinone/menaquinone biosynthesis methyltransferase [Wickerhamomyces ciferrii]|uniref:Ubiquinone/menaquinone biosynthesis methyltransferase n=1 Tax=Wickerhamomyces ciferrii (strain ATCC 14091 / BCRC 22168 / CBS 111 / JCM 3599 / NBRC 0793 / NRRL Y-1031 F-60-10) TaxID=1206466 RepID=K0KNW8_WICCF|nr:Ubiquinone/menaquinone biosynthesis methyltransferase [Wickerhamomyces ciferrii]CCH43099.1 Ubiquinone/menaquinone biosynthesis methyltransferase [Wickerhamomyces ciferrii]